MGTPWSAAKDLLLRELYHNTGRARHGGFGRDWAWAGGPQNADLWSMRQLSDQMTRRYTANGLPPPRNYTAPALINRIYTPAFQRSPHFQLEPRVNIGPGNQLDRFRPSVNGFLR